ncbi:MAG: YdcF family protein [Bacteroidia bacterium]|nr:YdcF family protein [Bacteroidia bacterium]MDW8089282.1 YdcF family protein [Bacteroidia bacterium]
MWRCWAVGGVLGLGLLGGGLGTLYAFRGYWLRKVGAYFLPHSPVLAPPWDRICVLSGRPYERAAGAVEAYHRLPRPILVLGGLVEDNLQAAGYADPQECALTRQALKRLGIPDSAIQMSCVGTSTYEEIRHVEALCQQYKWRRILFVTSPFHSRRVEKLAARWLSPKGIAWGVFAAKPLYYSTERWWESEVGLLAVWEEIAKHAYYHWKGYF